jgi:hypothetical protein
MEKPLFIDPAATRRMTDFTNAHNGIIPKQNKESRMKRVKNIAVLLPVFCMGLFVLGCGSTDVGGGVTIPTQDDHVSVQTNMTYVSEYTYSISVPPPPPAIVGRIGFAAAVTKDNSGVQAAEEDITWRYRCKIDS